jgi:protein-S-isoprenylcysteine O-methyltransferase Ste14
MAELLALITIITWPVIPLFWIPVHLFPTFFRKISILTYAVPMVTWIPLAYVLYQYRAVLLQEKIILPPLISFTGILLLLAGTAIHIWTGKLLSLRGLIGIPEVFNDRGGNVVRSGAFALVRHPTYLAHTLMFVGVFLYSGVVSTGIVALLDYAIVNALIIPLEERELLGRFGNAYRDYQREVPRFFPRITPHHKK